MTQYTAGSPLIFLAHTLKHGNISNTLKAKLAFREAGKSILRYPIISCLANCGESFWYICRNIVHHERYHAEGYVLFISFQLANYCLCFRDGNIYRYDSWYVMFYVSVCHIAQYNSFVAETIILTAHCQGPNSIKRWPLTSIGNPIIDIRRSYDRLIFIMGFPLLVRWHLYIESGPRTLDVLSPFIASMSEAVLLFICSNEVLVFHMEGILRTGTLQLLMTGSKFPNIKTFFFTKVA